MTISPSLSDHLSGRLRRLIIPALLLLGGLAGRAAPSGTGTITGRVANAGTGENLQYAQVHVGGTDRTATAGLGGEYTLTDVPAGPVHLEVDYTGLDRATADVTVEPGATVRQDFDLTSAAYSGRDVVKLGAFVVSTEKEGEAKAIMDQKAALNAKNVVATDQYGDVAEGNVAEFLKYMPGVNVDYRESDVTFIRIRGFAPQYTAVTMDGNPLANPASSNIRNTSDSPGNAMGRGFEFETMSINNVEAIEVTKVPMADSPAASGAGVVNMKSKRAFDRQGRVFDWSYSLVGNSLLPLTLGSTGMPRNRRSHPLEPSASFDYSESFFHHRFGVAAAAGVSNTISMMTRAGATWTFDNDPSNNATEVPRLTQVEFKDGPKTINRKNYSVNFDFKATPLLYLGLRINYSKFDSTIYDRLVAFNGGAIDPTAPLSLGDQTFATNTNTWTRIRGSFFPKQSDTANLSLPFEYRRDRLVIDGALAKSRGRNWYGGLSQGATAPDLYLRGISYRVQVANPTNDPFYTFTQLTGPGGAPVSAANSALAISSYPNPGYNGTFNDAPKNSVDDVYSTVANATLTFPEWRLPTTFKAGLAEQSRFYTEHHWYASYTYLPANNAPTDFPETNFPLVLTQYTNFLPQYYDRLATTAYINQHLDDPTLFTRTAASLAADEQNVWQNQVLLREQTGAAYAMAVVKLGRLELIPGLRGESYRVWGRGSKDIGDKAAKAEAGTTDTNSVAYRRARYSERTEATAIKDDLFPNYQARYKVTPDLILLGAYRETIQRPSAGYLFPGISGVSDNSNPPYVRITNPDLKPEYGQTYNLSLDYYNRNGYVSASIFRTDFKNKITTPPVAGAPIAGPEGVFGDPTYAGYAILQPINAPGMSRMSGVEIAALENLTMLPHALRGFTVSGSFNYNRPDSVFNFPFSPRLSATGSLRYRYRRLAVQANTTWTGVYPYFAPGTNGVQQYRESRFQVDTTLSYDLTRNISLSVFGRNLFNEPDVYFLTKDRHLVNSYTRYGTYWSFGIKGRF